MAGWDVNPNSPKQLRELFFTQDASGNWKGPFGEVPRIWSSGGSTGIKSPSTNKQVISNWAEKGNPLARCLMEHRTLKKLHGTYLTGLPTWTDRHSRIHTDLMLHGTVTGRISSRNPNLQNIPSRGEWGQRLRELFVAGYYGDCADFQVEALRGVLLPDLPERQEMVLIVADYEQLEMRIMAHMSQDPTMIDTIRAGRDLHSMTAALAGGHDYDEIVAAKKAKDPSDRQKELIEIRAGMKAVGFGLLYGIGAVKLGTQLGLPINKERSRKSGRSYERCPKANELIDTYFGIYPEVQKFIEDTHYNCEEDLLVRTVRGRYRRLPDILSDDKGLASQARRQSVNSIIQGSAADIAMQAMINCEFSAELRELGVRMLLQIHDELVFEVPKIPGVVEAAKRLIRDLMENPIPMDVPILVSMDEASSWGEAK
jgi:DNA polymerase-1